MNNSNIKQLPVKFPVKRFGYWELTNNFLKIHLIS